MVRTPFHQKLLWSALFHESFRRQLGPALGAKRNSTIVNMSLQRRSPPLILKRFSENMQRGDLTWSWATPFSPARNRQEESPKTIRISLLPLGPSLCLKISLLGLTPGKGFCSISIRPSGRCFDSKENLDFRLIHPHFAPFLKGCARPRKRMNTCFFGRQYTEKAVGCQFQMTARMRDGRVATGKRVSTSGILGYKGCIQQRLCTLFQMGLAGGTRPISRKRYVEDASVASRLHNQKSL